MQHRPKVLCPSGRLISRELDLNISYEKLGLDKNLNLCYNGHSCWCDEQATFSNRLVTPDTSFLLLGPERTGCLLRSTF